MHQTLLLNSSYEPMRFISERDVFRLLAKGKIEPLVYWDEPVRHGDQGIIRHPSVVRLWQQVKFYQRHSKFSRVQLFKRDQFVCQYCSFAGTTNELTIDHIIPKDQGGETSWLNCTTACKPCNWRKGNKTPEQAGIKLINQPFAFKPTILNDAEEIHIQHPSWFQFISV